MGSSSSLFLLLLQMALPLLVVVVMGQFLCPSAALQHIVGGGSAWTIPPFPSFYTNWSSSRRFFTGDTLYPPSWSGADFNFEPGFYNVMQVSRLEYEACTADHPFRTFDSSPATVPLIQKGESYFICSISNYCLLGQKVSVIVRGAIISSPPTPAPVYSVMSPLTPEPAPAERKRLGSPEPAANTDLKPSTAADSHSSAHRIVQGWLLLKVAFLAIQLEFSCDRVKLLPLSL